VSEPEPGAQPAAAGAASQETGTDGGPDSGRARSESAVGHESLLAADHAAALWPGCHDEALSAGRQDDPPSLAGAGESEGGGTGSCHWAGASAGCQRPAGGQTSSPAGADR
jgi:hypothetical protein